MQFRMFANPRFLEQIGRGTLALLLAQFAPEFAGQGVALPAESLDDEAYYQQVARLPQAPERLMEALHGIEMMATDCGRERLSLTIEAARLVVERRPESTHAEFATQVLLVQPELFAQQEEQTRITGLTSFEYYGSTEQADRSATFTRPDEGTLQRMSARKHQDITTCCRTSKPNWRPRIYSTTNPGGVGHAWYRKKFIAPFQNATETETRFIPARVTDNQWNNPEYLRVLEGLTGWQKRAWLNGDWDIAAGQFFTTLRREVHVIGDVEERGSGFSPQFSPHGAEQKHAALTPLAVFDQTRAVEWFAAFDYGFTHWTVCLLGCRDGDGNIFVVDEHAERLWLPQRHAAAIKAMLARHMMGDRKLEISDLRRFVAGADVFSRQSDGTTIAAQYGKLGITLRCANTDRINGWAEVLQRFGEPNVGLADGGVAPTLFIHKRCARLIETLPTLQHDPNRPEDVPKMDAGVGGDDAADALRYLVARKAREVRQRKLSGV